MDPSYTVEKRTRREDSPAEELAGLTFTEAVNTVDDLAAGVGNDEDGIAELEPGQSHVYTDIETCDEVEVRRDA